MNFLRSGIRIYFDRHLRVLAWFRIFASYSAFQVIVQGLGFLSGILLVRVLSKEDYAYFMIVNTIVPIISLLSDTGITNSLSAIGGKFWQDDHKLGSLVNTAMVLRRQLVLFSSLAVTPVLIGMLLRISAPWTTVLWLVPITLLGVLFQLNTGLLGIVINLRQQLNKMQAQAFLGVAPRLVFIGLLAAFGMLNAPTAVATGTAAAAIQFWSMRQNVRSQIAWTAPPDRQLRKEILGNVRRQAPLTLYFCIQGQLSIWLISVFGNVERVAEVGALGRIGMIFSIFTATITALVVPRFARCQDMGRLRTLYFQILLGYAGLLTLGTLFCWCFPSPLLWLIGPKYSQLGNLVWLVVLAAGTAAWAGLVFSLNVNRGWIPRAAVVLPLATLSQIILCMYFDLSSVRDVLLISVIGPLVPGLVNFFLVLPNLNASCTAARQ